MRFDAKTGGFVHGPNHVLGPNETRLIDGLKASKNFEAKTAPHVTIPEPVALTFRERAAALAAKQAK